MNRKWGAVLLWVSMSGSQVQYDVSGVIIIQDGLYVTRSG